MNKVHLNNTYDMVRSFPFIKSDHQKQKKNPKILKKTKKD